MTRHAVDADVLASLIDATEKGGALYDALHQLEKASTDFTLSILPYLTELPKDAFEEMIPALQVARVLLGKEPNDEVCSSQLQ